MDKSSFPRDTLLVGLTGGIGSGKSTVGRMLVALGAHMIDTDAISRQLTQPGGAAIGPIRAAFGAHMIDERGALHRERMRAAVFADPSLRLRLEAILHPLIGEETLRQTALAQPSQPIVFDVPLLVESGHWRDRVHRVMVIDCHPETQIERVMQRSGWSREDVERVIAQQASRQARREIADAVIVNERLSLAQLENEVRRVWEAWRPAAT